MRRILTVTLNPALDEATETPRMEPGHKLRCAPPRRDPGGGGANVTRALAALGAPSLAVVAIGGPTGDAWRAMFEAEGHEAGWLDAPGETRRSLGVTEAETGRQWRFVMPGPEWTAADADRALEQIAALLRADDLVVLSGSLPPGVDPGWPAALAARAAAVGAEAALDVSGPALRAAAAPDGDRDGRGGAAGGVALLRMDRREGGELLGRPEPAPEEAADLARELVARGAARRVSVALGPGGAVLASADGAWRAVPPAVEVVSNTGAGDSFLAGLVLGLARGDGDGEALALAVSAAAHAVTTPATALCSAEGVAAIRPRTVLTRL